jgi:methyl-accepting chemotaxis protein
MSPPELRDHFDVLARNTLSRWGLIAGVTMVLATGQLIGLVDASILTVGSTMGVAVALNYVAGSLVHRGWKPTWLIYALAAVDCAIGATLIVFYGPGGLIVALLFAIFPYLRRWDRTLGFVFPLIAAAAYLVASGIYGVMFATPTRAFWELPQSTYVDTAVLASVASVVGLSWSSFFNHLHQIRSVLGQVEAGSADARVPNWRDDELRSVGQHLNHILDQTAATVSGVRRKAAELADGVEQVSGSTSSLVDMARKTAAATSEIAGEVSVQLTVAEEAQTESTEAAQLAVDLGEAAARIVSETGQLLDETEKGRDRAAEASTAFSTMRDGVQETAGTVSDLKERYKRIAGFAVAISKIARQTHVLALNAAIEAARADERGRGFAVVAEQVRALAGEAGRSAREVTDVLGEVQEGIEELEESVSAEEGKVDSVGAAAREATVALEGLSPKVSQAVGLAVQTAEVSQTQAAHMESLAGKMSQLVSHRSDWTDHTSEIVTALQQQVEALLELDQAGRDLSLLAARLRDGIASPAQK